MDQRFHSKIDRRGADECWPWTAYRGPTGYGRFMVSTKRGEAKACLAHRLALEEIEPIPFSGAIALHLCDNPSCCNPAHLRWGTQRDNINDARLKGRTSSGSAHSEITKAVIPRGEEHCNAVLTADQVRAIRADPRMHKDIAPDYGISKSNVSAIKLRRSWAHVPD